MSLAVSLFLGMVLFGAAGNSLAFWVFARLRGVGIQVKPFADIRDLISAFRTYRQLAPSRGWPTWPILGFWLALGAAGVMAVAFVAALKKPISITSIPISPTFLLICVSLTSLAFAFWFTRRVVRKMPRLDTGKRDWSQLFRDDHLLRDAYVALLGWIGPFFAWLLYKTLTRS